MLVYRTDSCPSHLQSLKLLCVPLYASATIYVYIQRNAHLRGCVNVSKHSRLCFRASRESSTLVIARRKLQDHIIMTDACPYTQSWLSMWRCAHQPKLRANKSMMHWTLRCPPCDYKCFQHTKHRICKGSPTGQHSVQAIANLQAAGSFYM